MPTPISIEGMSVAEKLRTMELLWDDLSKQAGMDSPGWHGEELARREQAQSARHESSEGWEAAKRRIRDTLA